MTGREACATPSTFRSGLPMELPVDIHAIYDRLFRPFRDSRIRLFYRTFDIHAGTTVLDVGGSSYFWERAAAMGLPVPRVTILNLAAPPAPRRLWWVIGDALALPFRDGQFDVVFSNSLIEHALDQRRAAQEIRRAGRSYFVQTPDFRFPLEPHFLAPFIHWLPRRFRLALAPLTPWALITRPDRFSLRSFVDEIRLLSARDFKALFPEGLMRRERFAGMSKSLVAILPL